MYRFIEKHFKIHFERYMIHLGNSFIREVETCTQNIPKGKDHYLHMEPHNETTMKPPRTSLREKIIICKYETTPEMENGKHPLNPFAIGMHFLRSLSK